MVERMKLLKTAAQLWVKTYFEILGRFDCITNYKLVILHSFGPPPLTFINHCSTGSFCVVGGTI